MTFTPDQSELHDFMSKINEVCYCAGWMEATEFRLWAFMVDEADEGDWGRERIPQSARQKLRDLARRTGGWICWSSGDGRAGPIFVGAADWERIFAEWKGKS